ncbi:MAG TPA: hypothetical protein VD997_09495 [Phycisphaerales bacterium]|nr:hypothetical protein [Phycisphaerales bacterium]
MTERPGAPCERPPLELLPRRPELRPLGRLLPPWRERDTLLPLLRLLDDPRSLEREPALRDRDDPEREDVPDCRPPLLRPDRSDVPRRLLLIPRPRELPAGPPLLEPLREPELLEEREPLPDPLERLPEFDRLLEPERLPDPDLLPEREPERLLDVVRPLDRVLLLEPWREPPLVLLLPESPPRLLVPRRELDLPSERDPPRDPLCVPADRLEPPPLERLLALPRELARDPLPRRLLPPPPLLPRALLPREDRPPPEFLSSSAQMNLLKRLTPPLAVKSCLRNESLFSSNFSKNSSQLMWFMRRSSPRPGKSMRSTPASFREPVPSTDDGQPPRSSAHSRISSWSRVTLALPACDEPRRPPPPLRPRLPPTRFPPFRPRPPPSLFRPPRLLL